jgi:hypothetical protein
MGLERGHGEGIILNLSTVETANHFKYTLYQVQQ